MSCPSDSDTKLNVYLPDFQRFINKYHAKNIRVYSMVYELPYKKESLDVSISRNEGRM